MVDEQPDDAAEQDIADQALKLAVLVLGFMENALGRDARRLSIAKRAIRELDARLTDAATEAVGPDVTRH
jgi:hypothetical protein